MLSKSDQNVQYLYLCAKLELRDYFLKIATAEIYDNIGQILSFIKVNITTLAFKNDVLIDEDRDLISQLIGQTIADLRRICGLFTPELLIAEKTGFISQIQELIKSKHARFIINPMSIDHFLMPPQKCQIAFLLLVKIITLIDDLDMKLSEVHLSIEDNKIITQYRINGFINTTKFDIKKKDAGLSIMQCLDLISCVFFIKQPMKNFTIIYTQML